MGKNKAKAPKKKKKKENNKPVDVGKCKSAKETKTSVVNEVNNVKEETTSEEKTSEAQLEDIPITSSQQKKLAGQELVPELLLEPAMSSMVEAHVEEPLKEERRNEDDVRIANLEAELGVVRQQLLQSQQKSKAAVNAVKNSVKAVSDEIARSNDLRDAAERVKEDAAEAVALMRNTAGVAMFRRTANQMIKGDVAMRFHVWRLNATVAAERVRAAPVKDSPKKQALMNEIMRIRQEIRHSGEVQRGKNHLIYSSSSILCERICVI